jgi:hypothetical protein
MSVPSKRRIFESGNTAVAVQGQHSELLTHIAVRVCSHCFDQLELHTVLSVEASDE